MSEAMLVYVTTPDMDTARALARLAVEKRLAACANILGSIESLYWWDGAVQTAPEVALMLKTAPASFEALRHALKERHPYDCPCIVGMPISAGHPAFLQWINAETGFSRSPS